MKSNAFNLVMKKLFLEANPGVLAKTAKQTGRSAQFVQMVFWGERRSKNVERVLDEAMLRSLRERV